MFTFTHISSILCMYFHTHYLYTLYCSFTCIIPWMYSWGNLTLLLLDSWDTVYLWFSSIIYSHIWPSSISNIVSVISCTSTLVTSCQWQLFLQHWNFSLWQHMRTVMILIQVILVNIVFYRCCTEILHSINTSQKRQTLTKYHVLVCLS